VLGENLHRKEVRTLKYTSCLQKFPDRNQRDIFIFYFVMVGLGWRSG